MENSVSTWWNPSVQVPGDVNFLTFINDIWGDVSLSSDHLFIFVQVLNVGPFLI